MKHIVGSYLQVAVSILHLVATWRLADWEKWRKYYPTMLFAVVVDLFSTIKSMCAMLTLFALVLLAMGIWTSTQWVVIAAVIFAGATLGNNNTLITTAVMNAAPVERSTASAAYSFLRFIGGAVAPFLAGKLAEWYNPHVPFIVGAVFVLASVLFIMSNHKHVSHVDHIEGH